MTDYTDLRKLVIAALLATPTLARDRVVSPGDTASWSGEYPALFVRSPYERKESIGRVAPQFTTTATISVTGQLEAPSGEEAEAQLDTLRRQIVRAVINDFDLTNQIQQFLFVETKVDITSEGSAHNGQVTVNFGLEFYEGTEDFAPFAAVDLDQMAVTVDNAEPFDKSGVYENPPFPDAISPPPRTSGPDGRAEATLLFNLSQKDDKCS